MTSDLPPSLAGALRPVLPELAGAIIEAIGREVPAYARPLEGPFGEALRRGVRALARLLAREGADPEEVHDSARLAGWPRPATVGALVVGAGEDLDADRL